ncbi:Histone-lysine N-methyltransferase SETMAR [Eumeta japonica]|uniref:Histone-lysine N-methyltransferase SETMAR n=1 Tax=Eumeta variegata TaxID=151549 RepID=A0A4C1YAI7_EUMVA|nr:Histone-lysine N-methyltransferase SETMAR [Eumeta japonica]
MVLYADERGWGCAACGACAARAGVTARCAPSSSRARPTAGSTKLRTSDDFDVKGGPRSGRAVTYKVDAILEKVEQDQYISSYDIAEELAIDHITVLTHLEKAGYIKKLDTWVPH